MKRRPIVRRAVRQEAPRQRIDPKSPAMLQSLTESVHNLLDAAHVSAFGQGVHGDGQVIAQGGVAGVLGYLCESEMTDDQIRLFVNASVSGLLPQIRAALARQKTILAAQAATPPVTDE